MRGSLSLFKDIFEQPPQASDEVRRKGRSSELHARRNECLIDRYYFYGHFTDKRYQIIIEALSNEFFISTATIPEIISENIVILARLKRDRPIKTFFTKKWPHLSW